MNHKAVWAKAVASKIQMFDITKSGFGMFLLAVTGTVASAIYAKIYDLTPLLTNIGVQTFMANYLLLSVAIVIVPVFLIRLIFGSLTPSKAQLIAAADDDALPLFVRREALQSLIDNANATGADGWAEIWQDRLDSLKRSSKRQKTPKF